LKLHHQLFSRQLPSRKCPNQSFQRTRKSISLPSFRSSAGRPKWLHLNRFNQTRSLSFRPVSHRLVCCGTDTLAGHQLQSIAFCRNFIFSFPPLHSHPFRTRSPLLSETASPCRGFDTPLKAKFIGMTAKRAIHFVTEAAPSAKRRRIALKYRSLRIGEQPEITLGSLKPAHRNLQSTRTSFVSHSLARHLPLKSLVAHTQLDPPVLQLVFRSQLSLRPADLRYRSDVDRSGAGKSH